jgi:hypothetical protein
MELTAEMLSEVIEALRSNAPAGTEKRKQPRVGLRLQVPVLLPGSSKPSTARLRDVSEGGVGLLTHEPVENRGQIVLLLHDRDGIPRFIRCIVCYCRKVASNLYSVGVRFEK